MSAAPTQSPNDVILTSLRTRITAAHAHWQAAVADLTLEQVNHHERPGVLPIAFSLLHYVHGEDRNVARLFHDGALLWEQDGWRERVGASIQDVGRGQPLTEAEQLRFGDIDAWRAYQTAVFARTEAALATMESDRLDEILYETPPAAMTGAYILLLAPAGGPVRVVHALESFIYQHSLRHLGELEHARALVGLGGLS
jgi:hypothetical protein